jgi:hypothetical protein
MQDVAVAVVGLAPAGHCQGKSDRYQGVDANARSAGNDRFGDHAVNLIHGTSTCGADEERLLRPALSDWADRRNPSWQ